jgi:hypothetical protein
MSKFRASGKWNADAPSRADTGSIRGKTISNPIPIEDEDFPIRTPGTGIAIPLGANGEEPPTRSMRASIGPDLENIMERPVGVPGDQRDSSTLVPAQPLEERTTRRTSPPRMSTISVPSKSSMAAPQRKKSSLRTVFGRIFGKKRKSVASSTARISSPDRASRMDQHKSVSGIETDDWARGIANMLNRIRLLLHEINEIPPILKAALSPYP